MKFKTLLVEESSIKVNEKMKDVKSSSSKTRLFPNEKVLNIISQIREEMKCKKSF